MPKLSRDVLGDALRAFQAGETDAELLVHSNVTETETVPVSYFFREFDKMPALEQHALRSCSGRVLDVGAGAGSHALHLQQAGKTVTAMDVSEGAVQVMQERGLVDVLQHSIFDPLDERYDTLLLLMNGIGLAGTLDGLQNLLLSSASLLNPGGVVLLESTDIRYMFTEEDGSYWVPLNDAYYGCVNYQMEFKGLKGPEFPWLFVDRELLQSHAEKAGFRFEVLMEGDADNYLAQLTLNRP